MAALSQASRSAVASVITCRTASTSSPETMALATSCSRVSSRSRSAARASAAARAAVSARSRAASRHATALAPATPTASTAWAIMPGVMAKADVAVSPAGGGAAPRGPATPTAVR